ncbi:MgtC/SapB family protein [Oceanobacillus alkalisoli]|uniref:MgtC/SapB family protein n=1 Tax=Oceanobacillus alkalisoli TaxID=2925113 RepID=UPI001EF00198|nr:MgtC/SapB family protein [Oceanobacillus alkalisoli]MCF3943842.1 MgtC/SapB family protein [Oceanobacillus alkalisoli]MCG5104653.1 MgtC/SapB family protein [Oceanobacillus alkalisoli]
MEVLIEEIMGDHFYVIVTRLLVALLLSGIIGFEREWNNHSAGFRTHILVGVGASLMMLLSIFGFLEFLEHYDNVRFDPARIPSYVISGIGFLGAGTIIVYGGTIRGLTTAASIWAVAGVGLVVGAGMYGPAIVATLIILISLVVLNNLEKLLPSQRKYTRIEMVVEQKIKVHKLVEIAEMYDVNIIAVEVEKMERDLRKIYFKMKGMGGNQLLVLFEEMSKLDGVNNINQLEK